MIVAAYSTVKSFKGWGVRRKNDSNSKGLLLTGDDFSQLKKSFALYSLIYPFCKAFSSLDNFFRIGQGYMRIALMRKMEK